MIKCSYCGKENSDQSEHCERCGTALKLKESAAPVALPDPIAKRKMKRGALWCVGGIAVTLLTYTLATGGGSYIVAWGAIIFGAIEFFQGYAAMSRPSTRSSETDKPSVPEEDVFFQAAQGDPGELLNIAAKLESVDHDKAIAKYEEIIKLYPGTPASAEARRNIQVLSGAGHT